MADRTDLIDDDGENRAVRALLSIYQGGMLRVGTVVEHMEAMGWSSHPSWATESNMEPLTKAGAQLWIRHLLALEKAKNANAAPQREWQGLTAEQVNDVRRRFATNISVPYFVMIYTAIEAALRAKNEVKP